MVVGVIGGGASGMVAALRAAEDPNVRVLLFERQARLGRKLLATGNGRCNLSNTHALERGYHGEDAGFANIALGAFGPTQTREWFRDLGLITVEEPSGRVYPYSDQANSVVDILRFALQKPNIQVLTGFEVTKLRRMENGFSVESSDAAFCCDKVVVACGGLAGTKLGGSMSGYKLLNKLGHHCSRLRPTLVQLKSSWGGVVGLKGVRANCHAEIFRGNKLHNESEGELQFTEYGLSGPVIFEISRDACQTPDPWTCRLDFLPQMDSEDLLRLLLRRSQMELPAEELLTGILHNRLGRVLTKAAGISGTRMLADLQEEDLIAVCNTVKGFEIPISEPLGMDSAQVTAGGVLTKEFDPATMESRLIPGLYACGEVLDIDGDCGGYNLQWAWSSGRLAGENARKE